MSTPHLNLSWLQEVDRALRQDAMRGNFNLDFLLKSLTKIGFQKLRYFEHSQNDLVDKSYYVLRGLSDDIDASALPSRVLPADEINQHLPVGELRPKPFVGCDKDSSPDLCEFQDAIGSRGIPSIFVPIHAGDELSGKLCASWPGTVDELSNEDYEALIILSRLCGRYAKLAMDTKLDFLFQKISTISFADESTGYYEAHTQFLEVLNDVCESKILAIFESNWSNGSITKICEKRFQNPSIDDFAEFYNYGEHLSGFAHSHNESILITSVSDLQDTDHPKISKKSISRHNELFGPFESILFAPFESGHRDFVARLISRSHQLSESFSNIDRYAITRLCKRYGYHSNEFANEKNLQNINQLFQISISDFSRYKNVIDEFSRTYQRVFGGEIALIAKENSSASIDHFHTTDSDTIFHLADIDLDGLAGLIGRVGRDSFSVLALSEFEASVGQKLVPNGDTLPTHIFIINCSDADISGVLLSPIISTSTAQALRAAIKPKTVETLKIISAIIASAISASSSHITTENAKRLIGHIGHEIESPIADLIDVCLHSLRETRKSVRSSTVEADERETLLVGIETANVDIVKRAKAIELLMSVAVDMAQETENRLDVTYERFSIGGLVRECSELVKAETPDRLQPSGVRVIFELNERLQKLPQYVGDVTLLQKAFVNLFRNAVKYSYPPGHNLPITVKVRAIEQLNFIDFEIENWGVPIRPTEFERIFKQFIRGEAGDPVRNRRGMGLGLYIARRFIEAQNGSVKCMSSTSTFDDPLRRADEGYTTVFRVRLLKGHMITARSFRA